jgi:hypothetical protein
MVVNLSPPIEEARVFPALCALTIYGAPDADPDATATDLAHPMGAPRLSLVDLDELEELVKLHCDDKSVELKVVEVDDRIRVYAT